MKRGEIPSKRLTNKKKYAIIYTQDEGIAQQEEQLPFKQ